ncbi:MAG: MFS transporter [Clostridiales bacterium]|nr:MFS transporter [Clostridiales bacterium]
MILVAACCIHLGAFGVLLNTSSVFTVPVCESLGIGRGDFSMQSTLRSIVCCLLLPFAAKAYAKVNVRLLVTITGGASILAVALMSTYTSVYQWDISGVILGAAATICVTTLIPTLIGNWFKEKAGFAIGVATGFSGIGGSLFTPAVANAIEVFGWRTAYLLVAGFCSLLLFPAAIFVIRLTPQEKGLLPYGATAADPAEPQRAETDARKPRLLPLIVFGLSIGISIIVSSFYQHVPSYASSIGLSAAKGALLSSSLMFGNVVGKVFFGFLTDRFGGRRIAYLPIVSMMLGIAGVILVGQKSDLLLAFFIFVIGFIFCLPNGMAAVSLREVYGAALFTKAFSIVSMIQLLLGSFGFVFHGYLFDFFGTYIPGLYICIGLCCVSLTLYFIMLRMPRWAGEAHSPAVAFAGSGSGQLKGVPEEE